MMSKFDRDFRERERSFRRQFRFIRAIVIFFWLATVSAVGWGLTHPEAIGSFFGRIAAGFSSAVPAQKGLRS